MPDAQDHNRETLAEKYGPLESLEDVRTRRTDARRALQADAEGATSEELEEPVPPPLQLTVLFGKDPQSDSRVRIQLLPLGDSDAAVGWGRIFTDRATVLAELEHPALAKLLEFGVTTEREAFLVFREPEGEPISEIPPMSPGRALPAMVEVLEALEALALHHLVHWNVHPEHILIDADDRPSLVGHGASLLPLEWWTRHLSTEAERVEFLAPELRRIAGSPTPAIGGAWWKADLFSIGLVTCHLLGASVERAGTDDPSVEMLPGLRTPLHDLLENCLHEDPNVRPISFSAVIRTFQQSLPRGREASGTIDVRQTHDYRLRDLSGEIPLPTEGDYADRVLRSVRRGDAESAVATSGLAPLATPDDQARADSGSSSSAESGEDRTVVLESPAVPPAAEAEEPSDGVAEDATVVLDGAVRRALDQVVPRKTPAAPPTSDGSTPEGDELGATRAVPTSGSPAPSPPRPQSSEPEGGTPSGSPEESAPEATPPEDRREHQKEDKTDRTVVVERPRPPAQASSEAAAGPESSAPTPKTSVDPVPPKPPSPSAPRPQSRGPARQPLAAPEPEARGPAAVPKAGGTSAVPTPGTPAAAPGGGAPPKRPAQEPSAGPSSSGAAQKSVSPQAVKPKVAPASGAARSSEVAMPFSRGVALAAVAAVVLLAVTFAWLWGRRGEAPAPDPEPTIAEVPREVTSEPVDEPVGPTTPEWPAALDPVLEALASGDALAARRLLDSVAPPDTVGMEDPALCAFVPPLRESILLERADQVSAGLERALVAADLPAIRGLLSSLSSEEAERVADRPGGGDELERARELVERVDAVESLLRAGEMEQALVRAQALASADPGFAPASELRGRAATGLERQAEELEQGGRIDEAVSLLNRLAELWPDRAGVDDRLARLRRRERTESQLEDLVVRAEATMATQPHRGLEMLASLDPPPRWADRFTRLAGRLEASLEQLDAGSPVLRVDEEASSDYRRNRPVTVALAVEDDYEVVAVEVSVVAENAPDGTTIAVERQDERRWTFTVPASLHDDKPIRYWAVATDRSGHRGALGSAEQPIELKRRRWFSRDG